MTAKSPLDHLPRRSMFRNAEPARVGCAAPKATKPEKLADRSTKAAAKGGRPAKHPEKPWEREGISRMTWYRRQKAASS